MRLRRYPQGVQYHQLRPIWPRHLQQRWRARNCRDALLHVSPRSRRRIRPAPVKPTQAADRQYKGERRLYCSHGTRSISKRKSIICELLFPSSILAVKMNRKTLVIVLETEIYTYDISNMRLLHVIETTPNPEGEFTLYIRTCRINYRFYQPSARFLPRRTIHISPTHRQSHRHPPHSQLQLRRHRRPLHPRPRTATSTSFQPAR